MSTGIDVVYVLGSGAAETNDWELRISLRSWRKHFAELGTIWIVGHRPAWLDLDHPQIRWIRASDPYRGNKDANLIQKMLRVAMEPEVSDHFLFCSDDQGLLMDCVFGDFQPYHCGRIASMRLSPEGDGHRKWQERMKALGEWLNQQGREAWHFDGHIPYPMEKRRLVDYLDTDYGSGGYPLVSLYFNLHGIRGVPIDSARIRAGLYSKDEKPRVIDDKLGKNRFYSIGNGSPHCWYLVRRLEDRFGEPAPWEIGTPRLRWQEILPTAVQEWKRIEEELKDRELLGQALGTLTTEETEEIPSNQEAEATELATDLEAADDGGERRRGRVVDRLAEAAEVGT